MRIQKNGSHAGRFVLLAGTAVLTLAGCVSTPEVKTASVQTAAALQSLVEFAIDERGEKPAQADFIRELRRLYALDNTPLRTAAENTFEALQRIESRRITTHLGAELEQSRERSFELAAELQVIVGNHAALFVRRRGSSCCRR